MTCIISHADIHNGVLVANVKIHFGESGTILFRNWTYGVCAWNSKLNVCVKLRWPVWYGSVVESAVSRPL